LCVLSLVLPLQANGATDPRKPQANPFALSRSLSGNYLAALSATSQRDAAAASVYFKEVLRRDPRNLELLERTFLAALTSGDMQDAFSYADQLLKRDKANGLAHLALGIKAMKANQFGQARNELSKSGNNRQRDLTAVLLNAWTLVGSNEPKRALETLDRLKDERFAGFRDYHSALIADVAKIAPEAERRMKSAYESEKNTLRVVDAYGRFLSRRGKNAEARSVYEAFDPNLSRHPLVTAALDELTAGKTLSAPIKTAVQGAAEVLYGLGSTGSGQGDELAAMIYLQMSLFLDPENPLAIISLAGLYENIKQGEAAIALYRSMPETSPLRANADVQIGLVLDSLGQSEEAIKHLTAISTARPQDIDALNALGNIQRARKEFAEAVTTYSKIIASSPSNDRALWPVYYFRAISYERQKIWPKAEADFLKALELYPNQPLVLNYLGYSWADQGVNLDDAFRMLQKAVELRPTDGYIVDSLGWAHYRFGRYEEATKDIEKAVQLKPADPTINDHLGDIYWKTDRKLEAQFQWNHARDLGPEPEDLPKILEKIERGLSEDKKETAAPASMPAETPAKNGGL
jgi:tetratricopeptide (TPR) repeat protein